MDHTPRDMGADNQALLDQIRAAQLRAIMDEVRAAERRAETLNRKLKDAKKQNRTLSAQLNAVRWMIRVSNAIRHPVGTARRVLAALRPQLRF